MINRRLLRYVLAAATCCYAVGCLAAQDEEAEHLEHHIPAHKPETLVAAIAELERRNPTAMSQAESTADAERDRAELRDIIGWLPELAADSDLRKADWDSVQQLSTELATAVESWDTAAPGERSGVQRQFEESIERLHEVCRSLDSFPRLMPATQETQPDGESEISTTSTSSAEEK